MTRRDLIRLGLATAAGAAAMPLRAASSAIQAPQSPTIPTWTTELRRLAPDVYTYTQGSGAGVDNASLSNAGVIVGPDHLLAIDALGPPVHAKAFRVAAMKTLGKPFGRVVNTHHHRDHTNGNCFFAPAEIVAHEYCRQATIEQGIPPRPYEDRPQWQEDMHELRLSPATVTFTERLNYRYGEIEIQLIGFGPAHTWGDVAIYLPRQRILFAADLAFFYVTPPAHNGQITSWIRAIDRIMAMDVDVIVPGHGPIGTKRELADTRSYLDLMVREVRRGYDAGLSPGEAAAAVDLGRFAGWTNPERNAWNAVRLYAEFAGRLTPATDLSAQNQAVADYNRALARRANVR